MLLSLYDFKNVCKLKFVCTFCHGSIFKKNFYTVLPYFLSPVNSSFPALMEILFSLSLYVLNIDLIVFPLFIPNTSGCRIDFFSVFANTVLNVDLWLNLVPGAPGVDPSKHMESHWHLTARLASWPERIKKPLKKKKNSVQYLPKLINPKAGYPCTGNALGCSRINWIVSLLPSTEKK